MQPILASLFLFIVAVTVIIIRRSNLRDHARAMDKWRAAVDECRKTNRPSHLDPDEPDYDGLPAALVYSVAAVCTCAAIGMLIWSTMVFVQAGQSCVIIRNVGSNLPNDQLVAVHGEKGPQAALLTEGWNFGILSVIYDTAKYPNITIPAGQVGLVTAKSGKPLPPDTVFAPAWKSSDDMLDATKFLMGEGYKGPQLTVLPPAQYRYNRYLFDIEAANLLEIPIGAVAVIKANAGPEYKAPEGKTVELVNGVPLVPNGYRGIWKTALPPGAAYMHPKAYIWTFVQTTKRVYSYTATAEGSKVGRAITVKSMDGFEFPVDVRVSVKIDAEHAPYVVAMLANPDDDADSNGYDVLEERAILPSIRSIFRNSAETRAALTYISERSVIEEEATQAFRKDMAAFHIDVDRVYIAQIGLSSTEQGTQLLKTQTDKHLADQQKAAYAQQQLAEVERAKLVKSTAEADQEKDKAVAAAKTMIATSEAEAEKIRAKGSAAAYAEKINAFGGVDSYVQAMAMENLIKVIPDLKLPQTLIIGTGGSGELSSSLLAPVLLNTLKQQQQGPVAAPAAK